MEASHVGKEFGHKEGVRSWRKWLTNMFLGFLIILLSLLAFFVSGKSAPQGGPLAIGNEGWKANNLGISTLVVAQNTDLIIFGWKLENAPWCLPAFEKNGEIYCFSGFAGPESWRGINGKFLAQTDRPDAPMVLIERNLPIHYWRGKAWYNSQLELEMMMQRPAETLFVDWWPLSQYQWEVLKEAGIPEIDELPYLCSPLGVNIPDNMLSPGLETCLGARG